MTIRVPWIAALSALVAAGCAGCEETSSETPLPAPPSALPSAPHSATSVQPWVPLAEHAQAARSTRGVSYRAPSDDEREAYARWVAAVAKAAWADRLPGRRAPKGFVGRLAEAGKIWILREDGRDKRGSGFLALRPSVGEKVLVEAPHSFFEPGTLELALAAFQALEAKALLINTFHRGGSGTKDERRKRALSGKSEMDGAHNAKTCFAAAHAALVGLDADLLTVQFHGFADDRAPGVSVVISASNTEAQASVVAESLRPVLGDKAVRVFPKEIAILGGTTNVGARASRKASSPFLHIEMARSFRDEVKRDPALARRFIEALGDGIRNGRR